MTSFQIPERYHQAVKTLISLNEEQSSKFIQALHEIPLSLKFKQGLKPALAKFDDIKLLDGDQILDFLASLHYLLLEQAEDISIQKLAFDIGEAVNNEETLPKLDEKNIRHFSKRLEDFIAASSVLGIIAKASNVLADNERIFLESRILTDIRTVFEKPEEKPTGAVIIHNLKITYRQDGNDKDLFIALDDSDLVSLSEQITRAQTKAQVIKELIEKADITYFPIN